MTIGYDDLVDLARDYNESPPDQRQHTLSAWPREYLKLWEQHRPQECLAVYGTLAPGEENEHLLSPLKGEWSTGEVRGELSPDGWGMTWGFPALKWIPGSEERVEVKVFRSSALIDYWWRLDEFEGTEYQREVVTIEMADGSIQLANIYLLSEGPKQTGSRS